MATLSSRYRTYTPDVRTVKRDVEIDRNALAEIVRAAVDKHGLRDVAAAIKGDQRGPSHTAVSDFLKAPDSSTVRIVSRIQEWVNAGAVVGASNKKRQPLSIEEKAAAFDVMAGVVGLTLGVVNGEGTAAEKELRVKLAPYASAFLRLLKEIDDQTG